MPQTKFFIWKTETTWTSGHLFYISCSCMTDAGTCSPKVMLPDFSHLVRSLHAYDLLMFKVLEQNCSPYFLVRGRPWCLQPWFLPSHLLQAFFHQLPLVSYFKSPTLSFHLTYNKCLKLSHSNSTVPFLCILPQIIISSFPPHRQTSWKKHPIFAVYRLISMNSSPRHS